MDQSSFHFHEKKRVVVKIGSSSLNYEETGNLNFTKLEHLVRELWTYVSSAPVRSPSADSRLA